MKKEKTKTKSYEIRCSLLGTRNCPQPQICDGLKRKCTIWQIHSGK